MRNRLTKLVFPLFALLLLAPWPIAYAHSYNGGVSGQDAVQIRIAEPSAMPSWHAFGRAIGGVDTPGDLFYINATENPTDIEVILYLTNTNELCHYYSYLILEVGIYSEGDAGEWAKTSIPDIFITLRNGLVRFTVPGYAKYKVTIDDGCFNCFGTVADGSVVAPQFYLTTDQM